jgi:hypothetical protein
MASNLSPKISPPGSIKMPSGGRNTDVGRRATGGVLAKPGRSVPNGQTLGRLPIQNPPANQVGNKIGQANPQTAAAATKKPNRKGGAAFYGEV